MARGLYAGVTEQIGRNAFYMTVGIAIIYPRLITQYKKKDILSGVILLLTIVALLLTGKRGHLVFNMLAIIFVTLVYAKSIGKNTVRSLLYLIILFALLFLGITIIMPDASKVFMRFIVQSGGDITSGRIRLYNQAIELFRQRPIFGWGLGAFARFSNIGTHNIYLQLLAENGLVGAIAFVAMVAFNLWTTLREIIHYCTSASKPYSHYLLFSLYMQVFFIGYGITGNPLYDGFILIVYMLAVSIPYSIKLIKDN